MTVAENLGFGLKLRGHSRSGHRSACAAVGGHARAHAVARSLAASSSPADNVSASRSAARWCGKPQVFLLDEPLSNLDAKLRASMRTEIARLHRSLGTTMIYVTHDQVEAMTLGQRIVVLDRGVVQQIDTPMRIYEQPANLFVAGFLGNPAMNFLRGRVRAVRRAGDRDGGRQPCATPSLQCVSRPRSRRGHPPRGSASRRCLGRAERYPPDGDRRADRVHRQRSLHLHARMRLMAARSRASSPIRSARDRRAGRTSGRLPSALHFFDAASGRTLGHRRLLQLRVPAPEIVGTACALLRADRCSAARIVRATCIARTIQSATCFISASSHAPRRQRRRAEADAARTQRRPRVVGNDLLVDGQPGGIEGRLRNASVDVERAHRFDHDQVILRAAGDRAGSRARSVRAARARSRSSAPVARTRETRRSRRASTSRRCRLRRSCAVRPACRGTPPESIFFASACLHRIMPPRGPRSDLCVVVVTMSKPASIGFASAPPAISPPTCDTSAIASAPTSSAMARKRRVVELARIRGVSAQHASSVVPSARLPARRRSRCGPRAARSCSARN